MFERRLPIGRGEAEVAAARSPDVGEALAYPNGDTLPVAMRQCGLCEERDRLFELGQRIDLGSRFDSADRVGRDGHGADRFLVALVADVQDAVALAGANLDLVVHLGDQRTHRVDDEAAASLGRGDDIGCRTVRRQHDRPALGHLGDIVDEDHTLSLESFDDDLVVDDLVVAVDRRFERANHPGEGLDRHLDAGAEPAGFGQEDAVDVHVPDRVPASPSRRRR